MRTVGLNNYEEFIIDYFDGNLSAEENADLILFLEQHPSIKAEFESFSNISITDGDAVMFNQKEKLKKGFSYNDETIVAYIENDLSVAELMEFKTEAAKNPELQKEISLFEKTKLVKNEAIKYAGKEELKHKNKIVWLFAYSAAASIIILFLIYNAFDFSNKRNRREFAQENKSVEKSSPQSANVIVPDKTIPNVANKAGTANMQQNKSTKVETPLENSVNEQQQVEIVKEDVNELADNKKIEQNKEQISDELNITTVLADNAVENTNQVFAEAAPQEEENTLVDLAKQKLTKVLGGRLGFSKKQDTEGKLMAYQFSAGDFEFSKTYKSKK